ncbi:MAG: IS66 family transposase zinc-finger binding domain-containing protein [Proteobacteria bacterium]|nr:IS66 family transposase zinc-finger binding domain-containing protein [Pseudomonadota bacterium]MBU4037036.1 IS66 family transposase zinc-finger binding domain-containing protein [Pseudomonadota bacterium]
MPEEERHCKWGFLKEKFGEETSEKLDIIPVTIRVIKHIRYKYVCKICGGTDDPEGTTVVITPPPAEIIPEGIARPGLLAHIFTAKFEDALPFYRQEKILTRIVGHHYQ